MKQTAAARHSGGRTALHSLLFLFHGAVIVCNVTLDAGRLFAASKLRYGQIKSLELHENQVCWFKLQPEPGYRVELQIYRLVDMGLFVLNQSR